MTFSDFTLPGFTPLSSLKVYSLLPGSPWRPDTPKASSACCGAFVSTALKRAVRAF